MDERGLEDRLIALRLAFPSIPCDETLAEPFRPQATSQQGFPPPGQPCVTSFHWTPERLDQLESAARQGRRVALSRRGTEYVVIALRLATVERREALVGRLPMTGEEMEFLLDEIEAFQVV